MNIILAVHQFLPDYFSGTEILTLETAQELMRLGHKVTVFTGDPIPGGVDGRKLVEKYSYHGIAVIRFRQPYKNEEKQSNPMELEYNNRLIYSHFKNLLKREKPDIVHIFHLSKLSTTLIDACSESYIPVVMTTTDFWLICPTSQLKLPDNSTCLGPSCQSQNCVRHIIKNSQSKRINNLLDKIPDWLLPIILLLIRVGINFDKMNSKQVRALMKRRAFLLQRMNKIDRLFIPTQVMFSLLTRNGLKPENTKILPYGLNFDTLIIDKKPKAKNKLVLGYIGTIYEHKGVHILVDAVHRLANKNIELHIYGKTDHFPWYFDQILNIAQRDERIKFCGTFPNKEIGKILSSFDALVVPSIWYENMPLVVHSAQAMGCPVIASDMPGISEVIKNGVNGLLFEPGNVNELVKVIGRVLQNKSILQDLGKNAVRPKTIQEYVSAIITTYEELVPKKVDL